MSPSKATRRKTSVAVLVALAAMAIAVAGLVVGDLARRGTSNTFVNTAATYPGPSNTGVPAGIVLTTYTGPMTITTCGTVIEAKTVDGSLMIRTGNGFTDANHPCVTIRDSLIKGSIDSSTATSAACRPSPCGPVAIYDSEIAVPRPNAGDFAAISQTNLHVWRTGVRGARSGIQCDGNCEVHDSYVVADYFVRQARMDAYVATSASAGPQILDHNTFLCYIGPGSPDRPKARDAKAGCSGDVAFFGNVGKISNVTVNDNLFRASGAQRYAAYTGASDPASAYPVGDHLTWTANVFQQCPTAPAKGSCSTGSPVPDWASSATNQWCRNAWDTGALVFVHPTTRGFNEGVFQERYLWNLVGNPMETTIAAAHMALNGTMERHPGLHVLLAHGGGAILALRGRLRHGHEAIAPAGGALKEPADASIGRFLFDTVTHDAEVLSSLVETVGADRVLLGSDYPFDMADPDPVGTVRASGLGEADEQAVLYGNAERLLGQAIEAPG